MNSAWLTLAGLVADILGFAVLAWDVLPEYRIYRWRNLNKLLHEPTTTFISQLWHYRNESGDPLTDLTFDMRHLLPIQSLRRQVGLGPFDARTKADFLNAFVAAAEAEVAETIDKKEAELRGRWRPPLRFGIGLVILGFVLQAVGTIVTMPMELLRLPVR
jgi:hypothetical protein